MSGPSTIVHPVTPAHPLRYWCLLISTTLLVIVLFWLFSWHNYVELKRQRASLALDDAQKVVLSFEDHGNRLFQMTESQLRSVRRYYLEHGAGQALRDFIAASRPSSVPGDTAPISILDANGDLIFHTDPLVRSSPNMRDTEYFAPVRANPRDVLFIGPTRRGIVTKQLNYRLVLPIIHDGQFAGVVIKSMEPEEIAAFYNGFNMGPHSSMTILTLDHQIISRQPMPPEEILTAPLEGTVLWDEVAKHPAGSYEQRARIDGEKRMYYYKKLDGYPVVVTLGISRADILDGLSGTRFNIILQALAFTVAALAFCGLLLVMHRRARILAHAEAGSRRTSVLLENKAQELSHSNAELEQFAYVASHDLRQPLRQVSGYVTLLDRKYGASLDDEAREFIALAREGVNRMDRLIVDLLEYSRIGRSRKPMGPVLLVDVVTEAEQNLAVAIEDAAATIHRDLPGRLPPLWGDHGELVRLFQNLLGNAVKYRAPDRPPVVTVSARLGEGEWGDAQGDAVLNIAITDNGIGIDAEHFDRIFSVFQRLHAVGQYEGTGIGLSICKKVVEHHRGRVWVDSEPGQGSTFHLALPVARFRADQAASAF